MLQTRRGRHHFHRRRHPPIVGAGNTFVGDILGWRFSVAAFELLSLGACHDASDDGARGTIIEGDTAAVDTSNGVDTTTALDTVVVTDTGAPPDDTTPSSLPRKLPTWTAS
jgi:hypothetical protein